MSESNDTTTLPTTQESHESLRRDIDLLVHLISQRKKECQDIENETQYLKDYSGSFISMGDLHK